MKVNFILLILVLLEFQLSAQNQYNIWYTGSWSPTTAPTQAPGIDFNSGSPAPLTTSSMSFTEGSTMMCDDNGNLLFYTEGSTIWNANHVTMQNGSGMGNGSLVMFTSTQNAIAIPYADTNYYGLILNDGLSSGNGTGLFYSVIDMQLDGGLGGVNNVKDIPILAGTHEKLVAIRHANGCDFWIVTVKANDYYAFHFTSPQDYNSTDLSCTIIDTVITPAIGPLDLDGAGNKIKVSPTNDKIALKETIAGSVSTMDFDNATGVFSNPFQIADLAGIGVTPAMKEDAYSFSPDGSYLYIITDSIPDPLVLPTISKVYQFDMTVAQLSQPGTMQYIGMLPDSIASGPVSVNFSGDMQIGPDGKLYISYFSLIGDNNTFMSAINNPNTATPTITDVAVDYGGLRTHHTLPNIITDYLVDTITIPCSFPLTAGFMIDSSCFSTSGLLFDTSIGGPTQWEWNFGDPASGSANTSTLQNPSHFYSSPGTYNVQLIVFRGGCWTDTIIQTISTSSSGAPVLSGNVSICKNESASLSVSGGSNYNWYPSNTLSDSSSANPVASPLVTTTYYVTGDINGCYFMDSLIVTVKECVTILNDTTLCQDDSVLLIASGSSTGYNWVDSLSFAPVLSTDSVFWVSPSLTTTYGVFNTSDTAYVTITVINSANAGISNTIALCSNGSPISLIDSLAGNPDAGGTWNPAVAGGLFDPGTNAGGTFTYTVAGSGGCPDAAADLIVNINTPPSVIIDGNPSLCVGEATQLISVTGSATWSTTEVEDTITITPNVSGWYWATNSNLCGSSTDSLYVTVYALPTVSAGNDTTVTPFVDFAIMGSGGISYSWSPATGLSCINCETPTVLISSDATYCVTATDYNGCANTDCINITIDVSGEPWAPTIFSPNGDGLNDVFYIRGPVQDDQFILVIFNRWGEKVFETSDPKIGWDGTHNGTSLNSGSFAFIASGITWEGNEFELKGYLTLLDK